MASEEVLLDWRGQPVRKKTSSSDGDKAEGIAPSSAASGFTEQELQMMRWRNWQKQQADPDGQLEEERSLIPSKKKKVKSKKKSKDTDSLEEAPGISRAEEREELDEFGRVRPRNADAVSNPRSRSRSPPSLRNQRSLRSRSRSRSRSRIRASRRSRSRSSSRHRSSSSRSRSPRRAQGREPPPDPRRPEHDDRERGPDGKRPYRRKRRSRSQERPPRRRRSRSDSRSRSPSVDRRFSPERRQWTHDLFDEVARDPSPPRKVDPFYQPPKPSWKSLAGGVYLPVKDT